MKVKKYAKHYRYCQICEVRMKGKERMLFCFKCRPVLPSEPPQYAFHAPSDNRLNMRNL